jgi:hypothetical protein
MKRLLLLQLIFLPVFLFGQCDLLPTSTTHEIIKHSYYTLSYSKRDEQAEWVSYLLTRSMLTGQSERGNNFRPDPSVPSGSAQLVDYKNSGYDRGHLCPAGDMTFNAEAMSETFFLSNMSPQVPAFNRGIWKNLETLVREWAEEDDSIFIVTGGILRESKGTIGPDRVTVPSRFYKVIYDLTGEKKMIAFILPKWYHYIAAFFAGAFLTNFVPHFVNGISGNFFPSPFSNPPGRGLSTPLTNGLWALFNLFIGYLLFRVSRTHAKNKLSLIIFFAGIIWISIMSSIAFMNRPR